MEHSLTCIDENPASKEFINWKQRYQKEIKVNQELGRRIRTLKHELNEAKQLVDKCQSVSNQQLLMNDTATSCSRCLEYQDQIRMLKLQIQQGAPNQEMSLLKNGEKNYPIRKRSSVLVRASTGKIHDLHDILETLVGSNGELSPTAFERQRRRRSSSNSLVNEARLKMSAKAITGASICNQKATKTNINLEPVLGENFENDLLLKNTSTKEQLFERVFVLSGPTIIEQENLRHPSSNLRSTQSDHLHQPQNFDSFRPHLTKQLSSLTQKLKNSDFQFHRSWKKCNKSEPQHTECNSGKSYVSRYKESEFTSNQGYTESDSDIQPKMQTLQDFISKSTIDVLPTEQSAYKRLNWMSHFMHKNLFSHADDLHTFEQATSCTRSDPPTNAPLHLPKPDRRPFEGRLLCAIPSPSSSTESLALEQYAQLCFPYGDKPPPIELYSIENLRCTLQERSHAYWQEDSTFVLMIPNTIDEEKLTENDSKNNPHTDSVAQDQSLALVYAVCLLFPTTPRKISPQASKRNCEPTHCPFKTSPSQCSGEQALPEFGCLIITTRFPFFDLFTKFLLSTAVTWLQKFQDRNFLQNSKLEYELASHIEKNAAQLKGLSIPRMGEWCRVALTKELNPLSFHRPCTMNLVMERNNMIVKFAAPYLFSLLSIDQILYLLGCLCCERTVLLVSKHVQIVTSCVMALSSLLHPLQWAGPVITVLPPHLEEVLESPVPLIAGRVSRSLSSNQQTLKSTLDIPMSGVIEMNLDANTLWMHEDDLVRFHETKLPGCDALAYDLQPLGLKVFGRHEKEDTTLVNEKGQHISPESKKVKSDHVNFPSVSILSACEELFSRITTYMETLCTRAMEVDIPAWTHSKSCGKGAESDLEYENEIEVVLKQLKNEIEYEDELEEEENDIGEIEYEENLDAGIYIEVAFGRDDQKDISSTTILMNQ